MTTIAFDGKTLATDSLIGSGDMRFGYQSKLFKLNDGRVFAYAGNSAFAYAVMDWLNSNMRDDMKPTLGNDDDFIGIIVGEDGAFEVSKGLIIWPACIPWAGGSGEKIAMTAMFLRRSAVNAVKVAIKLDKHTGGEVHSVTINDKY